VTCLWSGATSLLADIFVLVGTLRIEVGVMGCRFARPAIMTGPAPRIEGPACACETGPVAILALASRGHRPAPASLARSPGSAHRATRGRPRIAPRSASGGRYFVDGSNNCEKYLQQRCILFAAEGFARSPSLYRQYCCLQILSNGRFTAGTALTPLDDPLLSVADPRVQPARTDLPPTPRLASLNDETVEIPARDP